MAKLHAAQRNKLRSSSFGLPGSRKYPMHDRSHAANAKARASQQLHKGNLSSSSYHQIIAKANRILHKAGGGYLHMASGGHVYNAMYGSKAPGAGTHVPTAVTLSVGTPHSVAFTKGAQRRGSNPAASGVGKYAQGGAVSYPYQETPYQFAKGGFLSRHPNHPANKIGYDMHEDGPDEHPHRYAHGGQIGDPPPHAERMEGGRHPTGQHRELPGRRGFEVEDWHGDVGYADGGTVHANAPARATRASLAAMDKSWVEDADHPDHGAERHGDTRDVGGGHADSHHQTYKGQGPQYADGGNVSVHVDQVRGHHDVDEDDDDEAHEGRKARRMRRGGGVLRSKAVRRDAQPERRLRDYV